MYLILPSVILGFTPGLQSILIFTSRFCFAGDSNSRNGECETCYRSTGKFVIVVFFPIQKCFKEKNNVDAHFCSGRLSSFILMYANNTTQALMGKN